MNRREMLSLLGKATAGAALLGVPLDINAQESGDGSGRRKILVIGAHPDDPETCAGGLMCLLANAGHDVAAVYLTRGEAGIAGKSHDEAAAIRSQESKAACSVTGARAVFLGQIDGNTEVNLKRYKEMRDFIEAERPDLVLTHWPIDAHRDHAATGMLVLDAWRRLDRAFPLYYFEAMSGTQSQMFSPTDWVDITPVVEQKHRACRCHVSQDMDPLLEQWHIPMERFRGLECRSEYAEAFARHTVAEKTL